MAPSRSAIRGGSVFGSETKAVIEPVQIGQGEKLRDGSDAVVFAIGVGVSAAMAASEILSGEGISLAVVDARFVKPIVMRNCWLLKHNVVAGWSLSRRMPCKVVSGVLFWKH